MTKTHKTIRNRRLNQLALTTALSSMSIFAYGRGAYAGGCAATGTPGTYLCSGGANPATDMVVRATGAPLNVLLAPGFGIDTSISGEYGEYLNGAGGGNALTMTGYGGLTVNDQGGSASIIGAYDGAIALNRTYTVAGDNNLVITASGTSFEGVLYTGLSAQNFGISTNGATNLEITTGDVTGVDTGLFARSFSVAATDSNLTINTVAGSVTGRQGIGIHGTSYAQSYDGHADFTVTTADVSSAGLYGISLTNFASSDLSSDVTLNTSGGHIHSTGPKSVGIVVRNLGGAEIGTSNVTITTASVTATSTGMYIENKADTYYTYTSGDTNLVIDTTAGSVVSTIRSAIAVTNKGVSDLGSSDVSINSSDVRGGLWGIDALNEGSAYDSTDLTITTTQGVVSATSDTGIAVNAINKGKSAGSTSDLSITTADVTGDFGIYARNYGAGASASNLSVDTSAGTVTTTSGDGLYAVNNGASAYGVAGLSVTTGDMTTAASGIDARNYGAAKYGSDLTIDTTKGHIESVTGRTADGIYALNQSNSAMGSADLTIITADISANFFGIAATNEGAGRIGSNLVIDTTAGSVVINPAATDGRDGISAANFGYSLAGASDLSIATAHVTGARHGVIATNFSEGYAQAKGYSSASMFIDSSAGAVAGISGNGVQAEHRGIAAYGYADLSITTADVTGGQYGIKALAKADGYGGASVFIDTTAGTVTGQGQDGIEARNESTSADGATNLIITTAAVTGAEYGIFARNENDGYLGSDLAIDTSDGAVIGQNRDGINAKNRGNASYGYAGLVITTDLVITTGAVTGNNYGIYVRNYAAGYDGSTVNITSRGHVIGANEDGIDAANDGTSEYGAADLVILTHDVTGGKHGIFARNDANANGKASSNLIIDSSYGAVVGETRDGIDARQSGYSGSGTADMVITTADVTGAEYGIRARNNSMGSTGASLIINTLSGSVAGTTLHGIYADLRSESDFGYSDLDITTAAVTGGNAGIFARNNSTGNDGSSLNINATGGAVAGKTGTGIYAANLGSSQFGYTHLSVTTGDVTGATNGIEVKGGSEGYDNSVMTIDSTAGTVRGNSGVGIFAVNENVALEGMTDLTITTADVEGALDGVYVQHRGKGALGSILTIDTTAGAVAGRDGRGIYAVGVTDAQYGAIGLDITTADVTSSRSTYDAGYRITHSAIVLGLVGSGTTGASIKLDTTAGTISSPSAFGMLVTNRGIASGGLADTTITTNAVQGLNGLDVVHVASGAEGSKVSVDTTAGDVTSSYGFGISVVSEGQSINGAVDVAVVTGNVTVQRDVTREPDAHPGVKAILDGTGRTGASISINTTGGTISNYSGHAILVTNDGIATEGRADTVITTGDLISNGNGGSGVRAISHASGRYGADLVVDTSAGTMNGGTQDMSGVAVSGYHFGDSSQGTTNLTITTGDIDVHNGAIRAISNATAYLDASIVVDTTGGEIVSTALFATGNNPVFQVRNLNTSTAGSADTTIRTGTVRAEGFTSRFGIDVTAETHAHVNSDILVDTSAGSLNLGILIDGKRYARTGSADISVLSRHPVAEVSITDTSRAVTGANITVDTTVGIGTRPETDAALASGGQITIETSSQASAGTVHVDGRFGNIAYGDTAVRILHRGSGHMGADLTVDTTAGAVVGGTMAGLRDPDLAQLYLAEDIGINADHGGQSLAGSTNLRVTTSGVSGGATGIRAVNAATGQTGANLVVDSRGGMVTGLAGAGIDARQTATSTEGAGGLSLRTGAVSGGTFGIYALSEAYGYAGADGVIDTTQGRVTGGVGDGIFARQGAYSYGGTTDLNITTADVTGGQSGIVANAGGAAYGNSDLIIDSSAGSVSGAAQYGITASQTGYSEYGNADLTITTADVTGGQTGIRAMQTGVSRTGSASLAVTTGAVQGAVDGIFARSGATAELDADVIVNTTAGAVNAINRGVYAVAAGASASGNIDVTVTTQNVTSVGNAVLGGINGTAETSANITINTTAGDIVSRTGKGIYALVGSAVRTNGNSDIAITTGDVTADEDIAVLAALQGTSETGANILIDTTAGDIVSASGKGIYAQVGSAVRTNGNSDITITTGDVTATSTAVLAEFKDGGIGRGSKKITIDTTDGTITSNAYIGIAAIRRDGSGDIAVTTADVHGDAQGIYVFSQFGGANSNNVIVDTTAGTVTRRDAYESAIRVISNVVESTSGSADMHIATADVEGVDFVNNSRAELTADVVIDTTMGSVTAFGQNEGANGISGNNQSITRQGSANLTITTADVTSNGSAIIVENRSTSMGDANLTIDTRAGSIRSTERSGIRADLGLDFNDAISQSGSTDLQITTADVSGALDGIFARNRGQGATGSNLSIDTSAGLVVGLGGVGVYALNSGGTLAGTTDLTLSVGTVVGRTHGVHAVQNTDGNLIFRSKAGGVGGYTGYGLNAVHEGMGATDIALTNSGIFGKVAGVFADHGTSTGAFTIDVGDRAIIGNISGRTSDLAIRARSDVTGLTLTNRAGGSIDGTLDLTARDDVFNNAGTWDTSGGVNDFGGGVDVVNNTSLQTLVVGNGAGNQATFMNNLELFNNAGRVTFVDGFAGDTLTLSGNFDGTGGVMEMELDATTLATDRLVVNGDVVGGPTTVVLTSIGGPGGLTGTGQNDGIALVQVAGTTSAADFQLAGAAQVDVFVYDALSLGSDNVWRVQSAFLPSINGYEVYPTALLNMTKLSPYRDRLGARQVSMGQNGTQAWLQMGGTWLERNAEGSITGNSFEQTFTEINAGVDFATQGAFTAGVNLRFSEGSTAVSGPSGASTIKTKGHGIGASLTWTGADGVYVDTQARYMSFNSDLPGGTNHGKGIAASVEVGRSFALPNDGWSMTHRAQLSYTTVDFDDMSGGFGETVTLRDGKSLSARFGLALNNTWTATDDAPNSVFGAIDLVHELMPDTAVDVTVVNTTTFMRSAAPTRIELGLGGKIGLGDNAKLYGVVNASQDLWQGSDSPQLSANFGFNMRW